MVQQITMLAGTLAHYDVRRHYFPGATHFLVDTDATNGTIHLNGNGRYCTFEPDAGFVGSDNFVLRGFDANGNNKGGLSIDVEVQSAASPGRSYYAPNQSGTIGVQSGFVNAPTVEGIDGRVCPDGHALVVNDYLGKMIDCRASDGSVLWRTSLPSNWRWLDVASGIVWYTVPEGDNGALRGARLSDGHMVSGFNIPFRTSFVTAIGSGKFLMGHGQHDLAIWSYAAGLSRTVTGLFTYPRAAVDDKTRDVIWVADTFGHRVVAVDPNDQIVHEFECSYPNDVQVLDDGRILVVAEHEDRVLIFDPDTTHAVDVLTSPFVGELSLPRADREASVWVAIDSQPNSRSKSSATHAGARTVYAPNGAHIVEGVMATASTDDQCVLISDTNGYLIGRIGAPGSAGFVSPTQVKIGKLP